MKMDIDSGDFSRVLDEIKTNISAAIKSLADGMNVAELRGFVSESQAAYAVLTEAVPALIEKVNPKYKEEVTEQLERDGGLMSIARKRLRVLMNEDLVAIQMIHVLISRSILIVISASLEEMKRLEDMFGAIAKEDVVEYDPQTMPPGFIPFLLLTNLKRDLIELREGLSIGLDMTKIGNTVSEVKTMCAELKDLIFDRIECLPPESQEKLGEELEDIMTRLNRQLQLQEDEIPAVRSIHQLLSKHVFKQLVIAAGEAGELNDLVRRIESGEYD